MMKYREMPPEWRRWVPAGTCPPGHVVTHRKVREWLVVPAEHPEGGRLQIIGTGAARRLLADGFNAPWVGARRYGIYVVE